MGVIQREIVGPQDRFERNGLAGLRDVRPFTIKAAEELRSSASALVLSGLACASYFYPALINVTVPTSLLYATWVLTPAF